MMNNEQIQKVKAEAVAAVNNAMAKHNYVNGVSGCELYQQGAAFGYSLAFDEIKIVMQQYEKLKEQNKWLQDILKNV